MMTLTRQNKVGSYAFHFTLSAISVYSTLIFNVRHTLAHTLRHTEMIRRPAFAFISFFFSVLLLLLLSPLQHHETCESNECFDVNIKQEVIALSRKSLFFPHRLRRHRCKYMKMLIFFCFCDGDIIITAVANTTPLSTSCAMRHSTSKSLMTS